MTRNSGSDGPILSQPADLLRAGQDATLVVLRAEMVALRSLMAALPKPHERGGSTQTPDTRPDEATEQEFDNLPI